MCDKRLAYTRSGNALRGTIVAFHGVTDSASSLMDLAQRYHADWEVILVDTLGHGLSARFSAAELQDPFAAMVKAAAQTLVDITSRTLNGSVVLMGHSLGGAIAATLAARFPQMIRALVLEDPALLTQTQALMYQQNALHLLEKVQQAKQYPSPALELLRASYPHWSEVEYLGWAQGKIQVDQDFLATGIVGTINRDLLATLQMPTLLITGDGEDVLFGEQGMKQANSYNNPNLQCVQIANATHTVRRDQSEKFYAAVEEFFDRVITGAADYAYEPYIDPELLPVIADIPEQRTWDLKKMRAKGEELLNNVTVPASVDVTVLRTGQIVSRFISKEATSANASVKRIIFAIHGGGYVAGKAAFDDARNAEMAQRFNALVVSPEYRLAPETPYPGAVEDCISALQFCFDEYQNLPVYLYGDSAGAGLVNQILQSVNKDFAEKIKGLILLEPCLDASMGSASYAKYSQGPIWTRKAAASAWKAYAGNADLPEFAFPYAMPPVMIPAILFVNPVDPLRDEALTWAKTQIDRGGKVSVYLPAGTFHGALSVSGSKVWAQVSKLIDAFIVDTEEGDAGEAEK
ncbi:alpha/beta hydrolase [Arcanobacterium hippocoleae]|uniref:alpha/beta hydrolase n=1 Tax=Arcanobacterium hippocoleae TaxID=149017 RepID=UPI00333F262B